MEEKIKDRLLEVGMYVRTKNGCICQILRTTYSKYLSRNKELCYEVDRPINANMELYDENIFKASHSIIDLIEVGDYVNGSRVDSTPFYDSGYITFGLSNNTNFDSLCEIKSILTKELYEANCYKVVE